MQRLTLLSSVLALSLAAPIGAQGTLVVSQNKCPVNRQAEIRTLTDSIWLPIAQELVNEGKLVAAGSAYHAWGDEWNVITWYTATDTPSFFTAFGELFTRMQQRHPDVLTQMLTWCTDHKDNIYSAGKSTVAASGAAAPPED